MTTLTAAGILSSNDLEKVKVSIKEWGGHVYVRMMTGAERDRYEVDMLNRKEKSMSNFRAAFLALVICDEQGKRLFNDDQIVALGDKGIRPLNRLWSVAQKLNALTEDDVEELEKN